MTLVREASGEAAKNDLPGVFGAPDPGTNDGGGRGSGACSRPFRGQPAALRRRVAFSVAPPASWSAFRTPSFRSPAMTFSAAGIAVVMAWPRFR